MPPVGGNAVKHMGKLIYSLALRVDLADDWFMGKVKIVTSCSPFNSLTAFFGHHRWGSADPSPVILNSSAINPLPLKEVQL
jgi:hypothetical protein